MGKTFQAKLSSLEGVAVAVASREKYFCAGEPTNSTVGSLGPGIPTLLYLAVLIEVTIMVGGGEELLKICPVR